MNKKSINIKAFEEACRKAEINLISKASDAPSGEVIIKDAQGNRYFVAPDMQLVKIPSITPEMAERIRKNSNRRRGMIAARVVRKRGKMTDKNYIQKGKQK